MPKRQQPLKTSPNELPLCDGPKLGLFQHHESRIQWFGRLNNDDDDEDSPIEGYVFRAKIRNRDYAIKVERDDRILQGRNIDLKKDQVDPEYQCTTPGGYRPRAIVKDLASPDPGVNQDNLYQILGDIVRLNSQRIFNMDIRLDNYRDGKLVDFGSSWTGPHILLDALGEEAADESRLADRTKFSQMVEDEKIPNPKKIIMTVHRMRLRTRRA